MEVKLSLNFWCKMRGLKLVHRSVQENTNQSDWDTSEGQDQMGSATNTTGEINDENGEQLHGNPSKVQHTSCKKS